MKKLKIILMLLLLSGLSLKVYAVVIPSYFDINGNLMHSADEFDVNVTVAVQKVPQGYLYSYTVNSLSTSTQSIGGFSIILKADTVVPNSSSTPAFIKLKREPKVTDKLPVMAWAISFDRLSPNLIVPSGTATGFSFTSPFPPSIVSAYLQGLTEDPRFDALYADDHPLYSGRTPYGPGKIIPVIGPVKPAVGAGGVASPYNNVTVQQCAGALCTVQLTAAGPQDPYGTVYTYTWSGGFGTVSGINPTLQLPVGTNPVTLTVSDPYGTVLTTATMDVVVVNPNPTSGGGAGNGGQAGGNQGGGTAGGGTNGGNNGNGQGTGGNANPNGDIDHDGIPDNEDDDRDGDGKSNDQDDDPDHAD